ncbi:hypothetical protein MK079_01640 [Candidatus Gracilibacteria bacterium]|nr:hypothetical protein [Candidatus Gracilibacteria bacterium]
MKNIQQFILLLGTLILLSACSSSGISESQSSEVEHTFIEDSQEETVVNQQEILPNTIESEISDIFGGEVSQTGSTTTSEISGGQFTQ